MSYTELHTGKLKKVRTDMTLQDLKDFLDSREDLYIEDFEYYSNKGREFILVVSLEKDKINYNDYKYIYNKGTLYQMVEHKEGESEDYLHITNKVSEDEIDFTYLFYNGGTCFGEMLEEGLNKLK